MTSVNSPASFEFPLSDNEACPPLGQGFDLIAGDSSHMRARTQIPRHSRP